MWRGKVKKKIKRQRWELSGITTKTIGGGRKKPRKAADAQYPERERGGKQATTTLRSILEEIKHRESNNRQKTSDLVATGQKKFELSY